MRALTVAQKQLWLYEQSVPGTSAYHIHGTFALPTGAGDRASIRDILRLLLRRHSSLRSVFRERAGQPMQVVLSDATPEVEEFKANSGDELDARVAGFVTMSFDLAAGPLLRVLLGSAVGRGRSLTWVAHHIVCDGVSLALLAREFMLMLRNMDLRKVEAALEAYLPDGAVCLPLHKVDEEARTYWRDVLANLPPRLALPHSRATHSGPPHTCAGYAFELPQALTARLRNLCASQGATAFAGLLAAFAVLMRRISRQPEFVLGIPVAGRKSSAARRQVGFFANIAPLRLRLETDRSFAQLVSIVAAQLTQLLRHQEYPFSTMLADAGVAATPYEFPLTPVLFNMLPHSAQADALLEKRSGHFTVPIDAKVDWEWYLLRRGGAISIEVHYRSSLFERHCIESVAEAFGCVIEAALDEPQRAVAKLPAVNDAAYRRLVYEWNDSVAAYPNDVLVHELFEHQAALNPTAIAIVDSVTVVTYGELNAAANRLARHLRALGVRPESLVAVYLERSVQLVVALMAVAKAGGAFAALDIQSPAARLAAVLRDASPLVLLTSSRWREPLGAQAGQVVCMDTDAFRWQGLDSSDLARLGSASSLAYVVYTSGTTGEPKGVLKEHAGLVNYLNFLARKCRIHREDAALQLTPVSFDPAVRDIFGPLSAGARVVILPPEAAHDPRSIRDAMAEHGISLLLSITPSLLREVCAAPAIHPCALRWILSSGEPLTDADAARVVETFGPSVRFVNQYGPSEITMIATHFDVVQGEGIAIGKPVDNVRVFILDEECQPVPVGVPGEIFLAGVGIARGYLGRPEATRERFVFDPFDPTGGPMFRTGDLARHRPDGNIEFIGRFDDQVKLHGVRVELGEVEAALRRCTGVRAAAAAVHEHPPGVMILVGYVVMEGCPFSSRGLREELKSMLPAAAAPSRLVQLPQLPLTPNGKIDRRSLALPPLQPPLGAPPVGDIETKISVLFGEVLGTDSIGRDDDFFDLGGNSLQAMRVMGRVTSTFSVHLTMRELFDSPTPGQLALLVDQALLLQELTGPRSTHGVVEVQEF